jgi:hypothetical protein
LFEREVARAEALPRMSAETALRYASWMLAPERGWAQAPSPVRLAARGGSAHDAGRSDEAQEVRLDQVMALVHACGGGAPLEAALLTRMQEAKAPARPLPRSPAPPVTATAGSSAAAAS